MAEDIQLDCPEADCDGKSQALPATYASAQTSALNLHFQSAHRVTQVHKTIAPAIKIKSPSTSSASSPDQWSLFSRESTMYKRGMAIAVVMRATTLCHCCDEELGADLLIDLQSDVSSMSEVKLLAAIKRLAVEEESTLVHRMRLSKMTQALDTPNRTFLATLKGRASLCVEIIRENLIRGNADPEILDDILGDPKTDTTLEETVNLIAQKE